MVGLKRKAVPQVRHTRTSYNRMIRANPFLAKDVTDFQKVTNLQLKTCSELMEKYKQTEHSVPSSQKALPPQKSGQSTTKQVRFSKPAPAKQLPPNIKIEPSEETTSKIHNTPLRDRAKSTECLNMSRGDFENISPIANQEQKDLKPPLIFKTPTAYRRRSRSVDTPHTNKRNTIFQMSTPQPFNMQKLQERLNKWLKSRGKPVALFHNLRTFTELNRDTDENKENVDTISQSGNPSFESLSVIEPNEPAKQKSSPQILNKQETRQHIKEALRELQNLTEDEYPANQCYSWLQLLKDKWPEIVNEPEYWECRATVEQSLGNVHNAVEFYQKAIIHGAEVSNVDKSLNELLKKFSLLNIDTDVAANNCCKVSKEKVFNEARNVFISTIINFAVYKRRNNKHEAETSSKRYAVPVRRSTRLSRGSFINTSGVQLCKSLKELDDEADIIFHSNNAFC